MTLSRRRFGTACLVWLRTVVCSRVARSLRLTLLGCSSNLGPLNLVRHQRASSVVTFLLTTLITSFTSSHQLLRLFVAAGEAGFLSLLTLDSHSTRLVLA